MSMDTRGVFRIFISRYICVIYKTWTWRP